MTKRFGNIDTMLGLGLTLVFGGLAYFRPAATESLELKMYDARLRAAPKAPIADDLRLVAIDDPAIEAVGRWPWPRGHIAELIRRISAGKPKVIGLNILYVDPDENQGLEMVRQLQSEYSDLIETQKDVLAPVLGPAGKRLRVKLKDNPIDLLGDFKDALAEAESNLDNDAKLAKSLGETTNVVMPLSFPTLDKPLVDESPEVIERLASRAFLQGQVTVPPNAQVLEGFQPLLPIPAFAGHMGGMGHCNIFPDLDGSVRRDAPVVKYQGQFFPSIALELARVALGVPSKEIKIALGDHIQMGPKRLPLDAESRFLIKFRGPFADIKRVSAVDVLRDEGGVSPDVFKNKVVLVGLTAQGLGSTFVTPVEATQQYNGVILAALQNFLDGDFLSRPPWAPRLEAGWFLLLGLFVAFVLPQLKARTGAVLTGLILIVTLGTGIALFVSRGWWLRLFYPTALLALAYVVITARRFFFTEKHSELVEAQSVETNRMLGLSFQGQGLLDMAFEKFQKVPVDDQMKGVLYNLALDFERKRQFNKAAVVYEHIAKTDPNFKDIKDRSKSMKQAGETMIAGAGLGGGKDGGTIAIAGGAAKPTLGRYEIQKELGRGAMGVVYLGKDPKINRSVAIKTLRFDSDMDEETAKFTKDRFFREAESAGTLNHPNIIRIFDAGEDGEIAYIAMELLDGEDLKKYVEKAHLLDVPQVLEYVAQVADALDYAHTNGVIHRDIKPANIMRLKDGTLRVTDFGIARIAASSKTATGTVMGTPSYMSPEQLSGKKVDGRSDLFSLGVMLYEMLTGEKPFEGDSIATLLFKIANDPHPDPRLKRAERVSAGIKAVIDKGLQKDAAQRYQRGGDMARDIRACAKSPDEIPAGARTEPPPAPVADTQKITPPVDKTEDTVKLTEQPGSSEGTQKL